MKELFKLIGSGNLTKYIAYGMAVIKLIQMFNAKVSTAPKTDSGKVNLATVIFFTRLVADVAEQGEIEFKNLGGLPTFPKL